MDASWREQLARDRVVTLSGLFLDQTVNALTEALGRALRGHGGQEVSIRGQEGAVYAARNLMQLCPEIGDFWHRSALAGPLAAVLGPGFGLVRVLFFDKPPQNTWALPWHKDLTIAVQNNRLPSPRFGKPTSTAGVPHVEAPLEVLGSEGMTLKAGAYKSGLAFTEGSDMFGWSLQQWGELAKVVGPVVGPILAAALAVWQVRKLRIQQQRGRAQELDAMLSSEGLTAIRKAVNLAFPSSMYPEKRAVPIESIREAFASRAGLEDEVNAWLGHWETVALTVYAGTSDENMTYEFAGGMLVRYAERFYEYIKEMQVVHGHKSFCYLEALARKWRIRRDEELKSKSTPYFLRPSRLTASVEPNKLRNPYLLVRNTVSVEVE